MLLINNLIGLKGVVHLFRDTVRPIKLEYNKKTTFVDVVAVQTILPSGSSFKIH